MLIYQSVSKHPSVKCAVGHYYAKECGKAKDQLGVKIAASAPNRTLAFRSNLARKSVLPKPSKCHFAGNEPNPLQWLHVTCDLLKPVP